MSQQKLSNDRKPATVYNTPILAERYDRFCSNCSSVIENLALEKYPDQKCRSCLHDVEFINKSDGLYRRCVRCFEFIRCTSKYCQMCGRANQFYDPEKPARLEKVMKSKLRIEVLKEEEERATKKRKLTEQKELTDLSQSCLDDGELEDPDQSIELEQSQSILETNNLESKD